MEINVVITSYHILEKKGDFEPIPYQDVNTIMYNIEGEHYKRRIVSSNRQMIDECDTLICYVDINREPSGAKKAMNYAVGKGLKIINLYREDDDPTFGMTGEERKAYWEKTSSGLLKL